MVKAFSAGFQRIGHRGIGLVVGPGHRRSTDRLGVTGYATGSPMNLLLVIGPTPRSAKSSGCLCASRDPGRPRGVLPDRRRPTPGPRNRLGRVRRIGAQRGSQRYRRGPIPLVPNVAAVRRAARPGPQPHRTAGRLGRLRLPFPPRAGQHHLHRQDPLSRLCRRPRRRGPPTGALRSARGAEGVTAVRDQLSPETELPLGAHADRADVRRSDGAHCV